MFHIKLHLLNCLKDMPTLQYEETKFIHDVYFYEKLEKPSQSKHEFIIHGLQRRETLLLLFPLPGLFVERGPIK